MTELLYMDSFDDTYSKEFTATVVSTGDDWVELDRSLFYPLGGGQPSDAGRISWDGGESEIVEVRKKGKIIHYLDGEVPPVGTEVKGEIDWELRHRNMRMHTCQHILSGVIGDMYDADTVGNQIHPERSRVDFRPATIPAEDVPVIEEKVNSILSANKDVFIKTMKRSELEAAGNLMRTNLSLIPPKIQELRVIEIEGEDICPCAGTHVRNTEEIGRFHILKRENKGSGTVRISYELV